MAAAGIAETPRAAVRPAGPKAVPVLAILILALFTVAAGSLLFGRYGISPGAWWAVLTRPDHAGIEGIVLLNVRLPRVLAGMLIGGGLSVAGAAYQGLFRNPMVSPDILGASAGAGFGAAVGILLGFGIPAIQALSFGCGLAAVLLAWAVSARLSRSGDPVLMLVLVGILVGSIFASLLSLVKFLADPYDRLPAITFWLMGSLAAINPRDTRFLIAPMVIGIVPLLLLRWRLNVLSFGEEEARALGIDTGRLRFAIIVCATLITAASVSVAGMIGWVGLVIPHLGRMVVGPNYKVLLPASLLMGSTYFLLIDDVARGVHAIEIPLGILTSLVGAPFFLYLLARARKGWV